MKKTFSILLLLSCVWQAYTMEEDDPGKNKRLSVAEHNQEKFKLEQELEKITTQITEKTEGFAKRQLAIHKKWDRKTSVAFFIATGLVGLKLGYDIYAHTSVSNFPDWLSTTNFVLDGIMIAGDSAFGLYWLCKSCYRKPKIE